jgi:hypothetical protein
MYQIRCEDPVFKNRYSEYLPRQMDDICTSEHLGILDP